MTKLDPTALEKAPVKIYEPAREVTEAERDVIAERRRQIRAEGWTPEHDDAHLPGSLALAGAVYATHGAGSDVLRDIYAATVPVGWPWSREWWKPKDRRRDLVRAAALIIAEIDRLDRAAARGKGG